MKEDAAQCAMRQARKIAPLLHGLGPEIQGAILAELVSIWLVGHAPQVREEALARWLDLVRQLIEANERIRFGAAGHPSGRQ